MAATLLPAQSVAQTAPFVSVPVAYLLPEESGDSLLTVHTADFRIDELPNESPDTGVSASFEGLYRFSNEGDSATTFTSIISFSSAESVPIFDLTANGIPLSAVSADGGYRVEVPVAAESSVDLYLRYNIALSEASLLQLRYDAKRLAAWPGSPSLRITLNLPASLSTEPWLNVTPDGWTYAGESSGVSSDRVGIQWLYDATWPPDDIVLWSLLSQTSERLDGFENVGMDPARNRELGDIYTSLYLAMSNPTVSRSDDVDAAVRSRLYAQALAAYTAGLSGVVENDPAAGPLWAGLAALYRSRAVAADTADAEYTMLMVDTASTALEMLPADDDRRQEVAQWQADGMRQLLTDAQQRRDWPTARALLDQMAAMPEPPLSPDVLAQEQRTALVLQALTLLEAGQQDAAIELAGDEILADTLQPDFELQSLFAAWHISTILTPDGSITVDVAAQSAPGRDDEVRSVVLPQFSELLSGDGASILVGDNATEQQVQPLHFVIEFEDREAALAMAQRLETGPDWILLRTLLAQLAPLVRSEDERFTQTVALEQSLDLREANTQWLAMAENLEQRALVIEAGSRGVNINDPAAIEEALRVRIEAANYRAAANIWRDLAVNSQVEVTLAKSATEEGRTWLTTVSSPAQTYTYQAETRNTRRISMASGAILFFLLLVSILLWRLL